MDKRGANHADWAISLGIFLLYILSMMMIIQPGVQPFYKEDELLKVVTENYKAYTSFVFYKTPIIIDTTDTATVAGTYTVTINGPLPFSGSINSYAVIDSEGNKMPLYIADGFASMSFDAPIIKGINLFYIISNKLGDGTSIEYQRDSPAFSSVIENDVGYILTIGSTETLQGVSDALMVREVDDESSPLPGVNCEDTNAEQKQIKYEMLKRVWGFPRSKDFLIFYTDTASAQYATENIQPVCMAAVPYEQANVVVEEWATRMFVPNGDGEYMGETQPIRMVARVW